MSKYSSSECSFNNITTSLYELGKQGKTEKVPLNYINKCLSTYPVKYKRNKVFKHYKNGLKKYCHRSSWEQVGKEIGKRGDEFDQELPKIKVCQLQNISSAKNGLKRGHRTGLKRFCNKDLWYKEGFELGSKADDVTLHDPTIRVCTINKIRSAQLGIQKGYKKGIKNFCQSINWADEATAHAQLGLEFKKIHKMAQKCVIYKADKNAVKKTRRFYILGLKEYCKLENVYRLGQKRKEFNFSICPEQEQDTLKLQYESGKKAQGQVSN